MFKANVCHTYIAYNVFYKTLTSRLRYANVGCDVSDRLYAAHDLLERSRESSDFVTSGLPQLSKRSPIVLTQQLRATRDFCLLDNDKQSGIRDLSSILLQYNRGFPMKKDDCKEN